MKPYKAYDLKQLLAELNWRMASKASNVVEVIEGDTGKIGAFFWKHFLKLSGLSKRDGSEPTAEEQQQWIRKQSKLGIERAVVMNGFGGVSVEQTEEDEEELLFDLDSDNCIKTYQHLYFPDLKLTRRIDMAHHLGQETDQHSRRYRQATGKSQIHTRKQEWEKVTNYDTVEHLYNGLIEKVDGMQVQGVPCTESNKTDWIELIPFWHKEFVLGELFRGVQVKNG